MIPHQAPLMLQLNPPDTPSYSLESICTWIWGADCGPYTHLIQTNSEEKKTLQIYILLANPRFWKDLGGEKCDF